MNSEMPLDFVYEKASNSYRLALYDTDKKLLEKVSYNSQRQLETAIIK